MKKRIVRTLVLTAAFALCFGTTVLAANSPLGKPVDGNNGTSNSGTSNSGTSSPQTSATMTASVALAGLLAAVGAAGLKEKDFE